MFRRLILSVVFPVAVLAQTNRLSEVVVTATRVPTPLEDVGSAVTVISHDEIVNSQAQSVADLLRESAGLAVVQSGGPGGQVSVFTRGLNSNQTLFLLDGARINSPVAGVPALASLTPDQIERIEIVRGPQSTLYGADAMGGVINIITRKGTGPLSGSATLEGGSYNAFRQIAEFSGAAGKFTSAVTLSHFYTDNPYPNSDFDLTTVAASAGYRLFDNVSLDATFRFNTSDTGLPGPITNGVPITPHPTERVQDANYFGRVGLTANIADFWQQTLFVAETHEDYFDRNSYSRSDRRSDVIQAGWQHDLQLADWNKLTAGFDWYRNHGQYETVGATPFDKDTDDFAGYLQDQATICERFTLTGGVRYDNNSQFGNFLTARGAGVVRIDETGTRLKAAGGSAMKAPTLSDLYQSFPSAYGYPAFLANPNLQPEQSLGWDAGIEQDLGKCVTVGARYFQNDVHDLITSVYQAPAFIKENVSQARTDGIEVSLDARPLTNLTCWAAYTWLIEAKDLTANSLTPRLRRPEHSANLGVNYRFFDRFTAHTSLALVSSRYDYQVVSPWGITRNSRYAKWDVGLKADVCKYCQLFIRVENLLDERYDETIGYPALGRTFWGGATARF